MATVVEVDARTATIRFVIRAGRDGEVGRAGGAQDVNRALTVGDDACRHVQIGTAKHRAVFQRRSVRTEHRDPAIEWGRVGVHGRADGSCRRGVRPQFPVPKSRAANRTAVGVVRCSESPVWLRGSDVCGEHDVGVNHDRLCLVVVAQFEADGLSFHDIRRVHFRHVPFDGLVSVRRTPPRLGRVSKLNVQAAIFMHRQVHPLVTNHQVRKIRTGMNNPVLLPPGSGKRRTIARRTRADAHVDARPNVQQFEPRRRNQPRHPTRRVRSLVNVHPMSRLGEDFAVWVWCCPFPSDTPSMTEQIPCGLRISLKPVAPQFGIPLSSHPHRHPIFLQPRDAPCPIGAHLHRQIPLTLIGKPMKARALGEGSGS